jgi:hypothetical protein
MKTPLLLLLSTTTILIAISRLATAQVKKAVDTIKTDTSRKAPIHLNAVNIKGYRNTQLDSLFNRKEFAGVFRHKSPGFKELLSQKASYNNQYTPFQQSFSSIAGINLLSIPSLLGKKSNPTSKLKQKLLKDEEDGYVNRVFSKQLIGSITHLQGDSLALFQNKYRPSYDTAKQTSAYDMILYIRKSVVQFKQAAGE